MPGELPRHDRPVPRPLPGEEVRPVGGAGEAFAVGGAELEEQRETAFAEAGVFLEAEALLKLHLRFRGVVGVGEFQGALVEPGDGGREGRTS